MTTKTISSGVTSSGLIVSNGNEVAILSGGVTLSTTVLSGGIEEVEHRGSAYFGRISSGGVLRIDSGGNAGSTRVSHGGIETIRAHGSAYGAALVGGFEFDYGLAIGTFVRSGGHEIVEARGSASQAFIYSGGREEVLSGGTVFSANIYGGGTMIVSSGGALAGELDLRGGKAIISGTVGAGDRVGFFESRTSGTIELDNLAGFHGLIVGLSTAREKIDLGGFAFGAETVSWAQSGISGTLLVTDGTKVASLSLLGSYTASDFHLADDGHGGSIVTDPQGSPAGAGATAAQFVEAMAGLPRGRDHGLATVHAGGTATMSAPPLVTAAAPRC